MKNGLCGLALLGMAGILVAAACQPVSDLGHDTGGSGGIGGSSASGGASGGSAGGRTTNSGVGDPCTPIDEYRSSFSGHSVDEVNIDISSLQCETQVCLVNHFQGRVSCPYGNSLSSVNLRNDETPPGCHVPTTGDAITVAVDPQLQQRQAQDSVYCSCRCNGPDESARYCDCPSGFSCVELVEDLARDEVAGSYCVRENTNFARGQVDLSDMCSFSNSNCGEITESGEPK